MCGICGFVGAPNEKAIESMAASMHRRGPDALSTRTVGEVHLGHTRLVVIDRDGGAQPMVSADGGAVLVYNGEIYDHAEVRERLRARGHVFRTRSDTEVVLAAYAEWGPRCVEHLRGMFAFVVHDAKHKLLFGARDRFGKKPLYYTDRPMGARGDRVEFAFASEATSLREHPTVSRETSLNPEGVIRYFLRDAPGPGVAIFTGVRALPPGHSFVLDLSTPDSGPAIAQYWAPKIGPENTRRKEHAGDLGEIEAELLGLLERAVERRLVSDVPLGVLLSGGIDSSAILAMAAGRRDPRDFAAFSIGFDDPSFDETSHAERIARRFGVRLFHRQFTASEMLRQFDWIVDRLDEPTADPSLIPTAMLSALAREHVTVALSGEGGDELFAGYDPFRALSAARWHRRLFPPCATRRIFRPLAAMLPRSDANMSLDFKIERFLRGVEVPESIQLPTWLGSFSLARLNELLPDLRDRLTPEAQFGDVVERFRACRGEVDRALDYFQRFYLPEDILRKVDRASMMHSLEVRCPFLDAELAEWVNALPAELKYRRGTTKWILKRALLDGAGRGPILPRETVLRKKKGFGIPVARWLRAELRDLVRERVVEEWPGELDFVSERERRRLVEAHLQGANHSKEVWSLLVLSTWARGRFSAPPPASAPRVQARG